MSQQLSSPPDERPIPAHPDGGKNLTVGQPPVEEVTPKEEKIPNIVKVACRWAAARGRPAAVYLLAEANLAEDRRDVPITKRTVTQLANALGDDQFDDLDLIIEGYSAVL